MSRSGKPYSQGFNGRRWQDVAIAALLFVCALVLASTAHADTEDWATRPATNLRTGATDAWTYGTPSITVTTSGAFTGVFEAGNILAIEPTGSSNGTTGYINSTINAAVDDESVFQTTTITFTEPVYNASIIVGDIDGGPTFNLTGAAFNDIVEFRAIDANGNTILPTTGAPGASVTWNAATGRALSTNVNVTNAAGNVTVTYAGPIRSMTIRHIAGANSTVTNPTTQFIYIETLNFTRSPQLTVQKTSQNGVGTFTFNRSNSFTPWAGATQSTSVTTVTAGTPVTGTPAILWATNTATTLTETAPAGWDITPSPVNCSDANTVVSGNPATFTAPVANNVVTIAAANIRAGAIITCALINNKRPVLTLVKTVTNDNGGTQPVSAWTLTAAGPTSIVGASGSAAVTNAPVAPATYALSEVGPAGYAAGAWSCTAGTLAGSNLTLTYGQNATCTINNNDTQPTLTLVKTVTNDNGGTAAVSAFTLTATGPTTISGASGTAPVTSAGVNAGTYTLSETGPAGYTAGAWSCTAGTLTGSSLVLTPGQNATCTINNNDTAPQLTLVKTVTNDNGGTQPVSAWTLSAAGPVTITGASGTAAVTNAAVSAGTYALSETGPAGYAAGAWTCTAGTLAGSNLTLALGQSATCTINNNDTQPTLTLVKTVTNNNGGTAAVGAFTLSATGPTNISGITGAAAVTNAPVNAGTFTLGETGPAGYASAAWSCTAGTLSGISLTLTPGQNATCTINNDDIQARLTLVKTVTNDNGGTAAVGAFTLTATGPTTVSGVTGAPLVTNAFVDAGSYTLSETGPAGYAAGAWSCTAGTLTGSTLVLTPGQAATCTINNNDTQPTLTLVKTVTNDNGGTQPVSAWTLTATGPTTVSGASGTAPVTNAGVNAGTYTLSEAGPAGYTAGAWSCTAGTLTGSSLVLTPGQNATCSINNNDTAPRLTLVKTVTNDNGGTATTAAFPLTATGPVTITGLSGAAAVTNAAVSAGTYALSETGPAGYTASAWSCTAGTLAGSNLTLALGQSATCTIVNDDVAPRLTLVKTVTNDNGGAQPVSAWTLTATGPTNISGASGTAAVTNAAVGAGSYTLSETGPAGYVAGAWSCTAGTLTGSTLALTPGQNATCTINNNDTQPQLTLVKTVTNDNGGTSAVSAFTLTATGPTTISGASGTAAVTNAGVNAGSYTLSETGPAGYAAGAWTCTAGTLTGSTLVLTPGQSSTCTINNNDTQPTLTLVKTVTNNNGGTAAVSAFTLTATGPTTISGASGTAAVTNAGVNAGSYTLSETGPAGYTAGAWSCTAGTLTGSTLVLTPGQSSTCSINNNDTAPRLTLVKTVTNNNGGTQVVSAWTLAATGPVTINGASGSAPVTNAAVSAGTYALSETGPAGYAAGAWTCTAGTLAGSNLTLALGQSATCTINNDDTQPTLTLVKTVTNDNGGTQAVSAWTLAATGPTNISGASGTAAVTNAGVNAGSYTLSETGPAGYVAGAWSCTAGTLTGSTLALTPGQNATCTINNNDTQPTLTLVKTVTNDNGGTAAVGAFTLTATGPTTISGASGTAPVTNAGVNAGSYTLSETGPAGYAAGAWTCTAGTLTGSTLVLAPGQSSTCTINNNDTQPTLTLVKTVTNDNGGTAAVSAFTLTATGPTTISGASGTAAVTNAGVNAGSYTLSEAGPAGYTAGAWSCTAGTLTGSTLVLTAGQSATCSINNNDTAPRLTLVKTVTNDNGGTSATGAFTLTATGPVTITGTSGSAPVTNAAVSSGTYALSETGPAGYAASAWSCTAGTLAGSNLTLALGQSATCTIVNDDVAPRLTLVKTVTNDNGGTATTASFTLSATGPTTISGTSGSVPVTNAVVAAGTYALSETTLAGYAAGPWSCSAGTLVGSNLTLALGQTATCTINNNDVQSTLTLVKTVTNDNGGTAAVSAFTLTATGPTTISGASGTAAVTNAGVSAGSYTLSETGPAGYAAGAWTCTAGTLTGSTLVLASGQSSTCTINNNDVQPTLTLGKSVTNDNGGTQPNTAWTLTATGPTTITGATGAPAVTNAGVNAGSYTLSETGPAGYTAGAWSCTAGTLTGSTLVLTAGQSATCSINNNDTAPRLTLVKTVTNDNGGTATTATFPLTATGPVIITGVSGAVAVTNAAVSAGTYALSEAAVAGYAAGAWSCTGGTLAGSNLTLALGQSATCTIVNDDVAPRLTLVKTVTNDNGGTATTASFPLTATGPVTITGTSGAPAVTNAAVSAGTYALSETPLAGYTASAWTCTAGTLAGSNLTLALGQTATCTINNNDVQPSLTLVKTITNDDGGTATTAAFTLTATGPTTISGTSGSAPVTNAPVTAGSYTLSEAAQFGYTAGAWSCTAGTLTGSTLVLAPGQSSTCTINNNDVAPRLTLVKTVTDTSGNPSTVPLFTLTATGPATATGITGAPAVTNAAVPAGVYVLSESGPSGYTPGSWSCTAGTLNINSLTLGVGQTATCTINNIKLPTLTLRKISNGAIGTFQFDSGTNGFTTPYIITTATPGVAVTGPTRTLASASGVTSFFDSVTDPWFALSGSCTGMGTGGTLTQTGNLFQLNAAATAAGRDIVCTITNERKPTVSVQKTTTGGSGGPFSFTSVNLATTPANITTTAANTAQPAGATKHVVSVTGTPVSLTESFTGPWVTSGVVCTDQNAAITGNTNPVASGAAVNVTIPAGAVVAGADINCVFTNAAAAPSLTILKEADTLGPVVKDQIITYTFKVKNTGNVPISGVTVADTINGSNGPLAPSNEAMLNNVAPASDSSDGAVDGSWDVLGPGDEIIFSATYQVSQPDIDNLQ